jgi:hypothetical protein
MKIWAQFYQMNNKFDREKKEFTNEKILSPSYGSDSVIILDARFNLQNMMNFCCKRIYDLRKCHYYVAFRLYAGDRFSENNPITEIITI